MSVPKQCAICGKDFKVIPARAATSKYCSYACLGASKKQLFAGEGSPGYIQGVDRSPKECQHCKQVFKQRETESITVFLKRKFCSKKCADIAGFRYTGKDHPNYSEEAERTLSRGRLMDRWGNLVKARDGFKCVMCGSAEKELHAHHVKPWKSHPELRYEVSNGITVCAPCHWNIHAAENENPVNSVEPLTAKPTAEGNTEPSFGRKPVEGVTTRGRAYRRWFGYCAECKVPITKRWSDTTGKENLFCDKRCSSTFNQRAKKIGRHAKPPMAVIASTSPGRESEEIV